VERLCEFQNRRRSGKRRCGIRRQQLVDTLFPKRNVMICQPLLSVYPI
jgi:hypothetical protein